MKIKDYKSQEICDLLDSGKISILEELGAGDLRREMDRVGSLCSFFIMLICRKKDDKGLRKRAARMIRAVAPSGMTGDLPQTDDTVVVGFNHPSLGEVCRLIYIGMEQYPDREFLYPVNLPWYESITGIIPELARLGIHITPMMTPATEEKLNKRFEGDQDKLDDIEFLRMVFDRRYIREIKSIAQKKGAIFVAPSATRQREIIGDYVHPSMTVVAHLVLKGGRRATFVPVAVVSPVLANRELNLFRRYRFIPCETFSSEEVAKLTAGRDRAFDFTFLRRIEKAYLDNTLF
jgi:hypothetical protein